MGAKSEFEMKAAEVIVAEDKGIEFLAGRGAKNTAGTMNSCPAKVYL